LAPLDSYEDELTEWCELVEAEFPHDQNLEVLDLGTGGGHHLYHLFNQLERLKSGWVVDLSQEMLKQATGLIPAVKPVVSDMTTVRVDGTFRLVTVHDSFCYLTTEAQVRALFETICHHLQAGGLGMVKVDAVSDSFAGPYRYLTNFEENGLEITLTHYEWDPIPGDGWLEVIYLFLRREGAAVTTREERHRLGVFSKDFLIETARSCGLQAKFHQLERWDEERENLLLLLKHRTPD
jgi:SAM-dependent methyltransferase